MQNKWKYYGNLAKTNTNTLFLKYSNANANISDNVFKCIEMAKAFVFEPMSS